MILLPYLLSLIALLFGINKLIKNQFFIWILFQIKFHILKKRIYNFSKKKYLSNTYNILQISEELNKMKLSSNIYLQNHTENIDKIYNRYIPNFSRNKYKKHLLFFFILFILLLSTFQHYRIYSGSMLPTLQIGDLVFTSKICYGLKSPIFRNQYTITWCNPKQGDIIIFEAPNYVPKYANQVWTKRVIALAGQNISIKDSIIYIDNKPLYQSKFKYKWYIPFKEKLFLKKIIIESQEKIHSILPHKIYSSLSKQNWPNKSTPHLNGLICSENHCTIKEGYVFVLGDNRGNSLDSRTWGAVPCNHIKGKIIGISFNIHKSKEILKFKFFYLPQIKFLRIGSSIS
ncbi:MAG: signal peptidase I [Deltaproteobacteria bacterium]|nr:MAG: signal peptidase I [Deltaproteobacteria bacterium]